MEDMIHNPVALRARQELRTEADQPARRDKELHADIARQLRHIRQLRLARTERLHHGAHILLRNLDRQILHWLALLSVDRLVDNLGLANLQFIALTAHLLDQNGKMQLTAPRYLEHIGRIRLLDVHSDIRLDLLEQAITQMA